MILKVKKGQNPYYVIERYIYEHTEVMEDMIAVLEIDGVRTNELLEVDSYYDGWIWVNDWWEGEPEVDLIDFFPVSQACNPKTYIPIEWIEQYVERKTVLVGVAELWIKWMIEDWEKEQEKAIDNLPVVDAEPVRHGRWDYVTVVDEGFWRCSNCGTPSEAIGAKKLYKYCPFCGAKMGEQNDTD